MVYSLDELTRKISPIAQKYKLRAVYVFGSYARNEATDDSDVDVLVDLTDSDVVGWVLGGLYEDLCKGIGKKVDLVTTRALTQDGNNDKSPWFTKSVQREKVSVYEKR